jgi:hypothetical protein
MIEQLAKYHQDKMQRECDRLQEELEREAELERFERLKEERRSKRAEIQKMQLEAYRAEKELRRSR